MSLQEFLLAELQDGARSRTPAEVVADTERALADSGGQSFGSVSSVAFIRADRDGR